MFSEESFANWSKDYVIFAHITTRIKDQKNDDLLTKVGGPGFPHFVFMDAEGELLATHNGEWATADFTKTATLAKEGSAIKAKAAKGDAAAKIEWFCRQLDQGSISFAEANTKVKSIGKLSAAQQKQVDAALFNLEVNDLGNRVQSEEQAKEAGKKMTEWLKAKKVPTGGALDSFINFTLGYCKEEKDVEGFSLAIALVKEKYGSNEKAKPAIERLEKDLEAMKAEKK
ncbi:MAG: hypothetical protein ACKVS6_16505 [Planctomycetota bacterium]